jgi:hypothetical protein
VSYHTCFISFLLVLFACLRLCHAFSMLSVSLDCPFQKIQKISNKDSTKKTGVSSGDREEMEHAVISCHKSVFIHTTCTCSQCLKLDRYVLSEINVKENRRGNQGPFFFAFILSRVSLLINMNIKLKRQN